jgi:TonB family protein
VSHLLTRSLVLGTFGGLTPGKSHNRTCGFRSLDGYGDQLQTSDATGRGTDLFFRTATKRRMNCVLAVLQVLTAGAMFAWPLAKLQAQARESPPTKQVNSPSVEILTPSEGVDFSVFLNHLCRAVKRNWYVLMPQSALLGEKAKVVLRLQLQKDGTLLGQTPSVEVSSGTKSMDSAAIAAIRTSAPFEHLPEAFRGPNIELRLTFFYNTSPAPIQHP